MLNDGKLSEYVVYVDESGDANLDKISPTFPVFVLSFCIFKKSDYCEKVIPAMSKLKFDTFGHDMVVLHEREIRKKEGSFKLLNMERREEFLSCLTRIIDETPMVLLSVVIDKVKLRERYAYPEGPYSLAMQYGLERLYEFAQSVGQEDALWHIVCEARGKVEDNNLKLAFQEICTGKNKQKRSFPFEVIFAPKSVNSNGLQLADLTARPVGLFYLRPFESNRTYEILVKKFWKGTRGITCIGNGLKIFPYDSPF